MTDEHLRIEREGPLARVTLNRPEIHNAFDDQLVRRLARAAAGSDDAWLDSKVDTAVFYATNILPRAGGLEAAATAGSAPGGRGPIRARSRWPPAIGPGAP